MDETTRSNDGSALSALEDLLNTKDTNVVYAILIIIILLLVGFIVLLIFCIYYYGFKNQPAAKKASLRQDNFNSH